MRVVFLNILAWLLLFASLQLPPPQENYYPLQHRLLENFHGQEFSGRDVFSLISGQAHLFGRNTGETPASFVRLATDVLPSLFQLTLDGLPRRRRQKINGINLILLVLMWLRKYLHVDTYVLWFDIDIDPNFSYSHNTQNSARTLAILAQPDQMAEPLGMAKPNWKLA